MTRDSFRLAGQRPAWHIITGEYPPQTGGVSDYARTIAEGLAEAGEEVHVWCPAHEAVEEARAGGAREAVNAKEQGAARGPFVHRAGGRFLPSDLWRAGRMLNGTDAPRRLFVQYVPHAFGCRSMNLPFCLWVWWRARVRRDRVEVMLHEPFLESRRGAWGHSAAAFVHRLMAFVMLRAASRVWTATPAWERLWRPLAFGRRVAFEWLPVPSTITPTNDAEAVRAVRGRYLESHERLLVGHLGTYPRHVAQELGSLLPALLERRAEASALLLGRGGAEVRDEIVSLHPRLAGRLHATGTIPARELSAHVAACDLFIQPFPDGVTTRRTSVMAALAHGRAVVTTGGRLTEPLWAESGALALAPADDTAALVAKASALLADAIERERLGAAGLSLYRERFEASKSVAALRCEGATPAGEASPVCGETAHEEVLAEAGGEVLSKECVSRS